MVCYPLYYQYQTIIIFTHKQQRQTTFSKSGNLLWGMSDVFYPAVWIGSLLEAWFMQVFRKSRQNSSMNSLAYEKGKTSNPPAPSSCVVLFCLLVSCSRVVSCLLTSCLVAACPIFTCLFSSSTTTPFVLVSFLYTTPCLYPPASVRLLLTNYISPSCAIAVTLY